MKQLQKLCMRHLFTAFILLRQTCFVCKVPTTGSGQHLQLWQLPHGVTPPHIHCLHAAVCLTAPGLWRSRWGK
jgi:hypothetical protein